MDRGTNPQWIADHLKHVEAHARNIELMEKMADRYREPVSQRINDAFRYFAGIALFAMAAMIAAAVINYQ